MGTRLKELREAEGSTQAKIAYESGVSRQDISRYEKDTRTIGFDNMIALADYFGVSLDYLLGRNDE